MTPPSGGAAEPLLLATRNPGKLRELRPLFAAAGRAVVDLSDVGIAERAEEDALEAFDSFEANALAKARYFRELSGLPTVADDSGLEVRALGGRPGVHSKRFSGAPGLHGPALDAANNARLLQELAGAADRRARFVCVAAYVDGARDLAERGTVEGRIIESAVGAHGFGYDPLFLADEAGRTLGELTVEEKSRLSHRARAFAALLAVLQTS